MWLTLYSIGWWNDWWIMNLTGCGRNWLCPDRDAIPEFAWRDRGKPRNTTVRIADVQAEIRTDPRLRPSWRVQNKINKCRQNCLGRMTAGTIPKQTVQCKPKGHRDQARPWKRWNEYVRSEQAWLHIPCSEEVEEECVCKESTAALLSSEQRSSVVIMSWPVHPEVKWLAQRRKSLNKEAWPHGWWRGGHRVNRFRVAAAGCHHDDSCLVSSYATSSARSYRLQVGLTL
jgi:hypothetical protein